MTVLELDQFTATATNLKEMFFRDFEADHAKTLLALYGGNSFAARRIFGGHAVIKEVTLQDKPPKGSVWYVEDEIGGLSRYLSNCDSSD
jgi:hypothetical protein